MPATTIASTVPTATRPEACAYVAHQGAVLNRIEAGAHDR